MSRQKSLVNKRQWERTRQQLRNLRINGRKAVTSSTAIEGKTEGAPRRESDHLELYVRNDTGDDVDRFGVLALSAPLTTPSDSLSRFLEIPEFSSTGSAPWPNNANDLVIAQEPIPAGKVGRCVLSGATPVQLYVDNDSAANTYATVRDYDATQLEASTSGIAQVRWREGGTGTQWALVVMGVAAPEVPNAVQSFIGTVEGSDVKIKGGRVQGFGLEFIDFIREIPGRTISLSTDTEAWIELKREDGGLGVESGSIETGTMPDRYEIIQPPGSSVRRLIIRVKIGEVKNSQWEQHYQGGDFVSDSLLRSDVASYMDQDYHKDGSLLTLSNVDSNANQADGPQLNVKDPIDWLTSFVINNSGTSGTTVMQWSRNSIFDDWTVTLREVETLDVVTSVNFALEIATEETVTVLK